MTATTEHSRKQVWEIIADQESELIRLRALEQMRQTELKRLAFECASLQLTVTRLTKELTDQRQRLAFALKTVEQALQQTP
jgi:hypothetical protein